MNTPAVCPECSTYLRGITVDGLHRGCYLRRLLQVEHPELKGMIDQCMIVIDVYHAQSDPESAYSLRSGAKDRFLSVIEEAWEGGYVVEAKHLHNDALAPLYGGCWFCHRGSGTTFWSESLDSCVHIECLRNAVHKHDDPETVHKIAKEFGVPFPEEARHRYDWMTQLVLVLACLFMVAGWIWYMTDRPVYPVGYLFGAVFLFIFVGMRRRKV